MPVFEILINALYYAILVSLCLYGIHRFHIIRLCRKYRQVNSGPAQLFESLPQVTIQLPIYNEKYVIRRLIEAVCALEYPRECLEIQVLDDSTDDTSAAVMELTAQYRERGYNINHLRRSHREGFKAGALREGLKSASGEFIAIFDADFIPPPRFLLDSIHYFTDPQIGMVQHRWDYINRDYSWLTRFQALFLDGHFILEHTARSRSGCFFNFNGTAGIWRREAIRDSGGWTCDTLTEDLDLSYRAQLNGWKFIYLLDRTTPCEIPVDINAFKSQQHRWAKGSIQTAKKILPRIWKSGLPLSQKLESSVHLAGNALHVLIVLLSLLFLPVMMLRLDWPWQASLAVDSALLFLGTFSILRFYYHCQRMKGVSIWSSLVVLPGLLSLGAGVGLNNTFAVMEALLGKSSAFIRTPKYGVTRSSDIWKGKDYNKNTDRLAILEIAMALYLTVAVYYAGMHGLWLFLPFPLVFALGFWAVGLGSIWQGRSRNAVSAHTVQAA